MAWAMGAGRVAVTGRSQETLEDFARKSRTKSIGSPAGSQIDLRSCASSPVNRTVRMRRPYRLAEFGLDEANEAVAYAAAHAGPRQLTVLRRQSQSTDKLAS